MKAVKRLFFETEMGYLKTVVFAVITAVITAVMLIIPFTANTSLANIGVSFEWWIVFAIFIVTNSKKMLEAGIKCFLFFLISQPLIYLFQVPFYSGGFEIFMYYPRWFIWTLLCFPGGIIAWFIKKNNLLSAAVLSVATGFMLSEETYFIPSVINYFPKNLLSAVFCAAVPFLLIFIVLSGKKERILSCALTLLFGGAMWFFLY